MGAPELCKSSSCRTDSPFLKVLDALPDSLPLIGLRSDIKRALVGFGRHEILLATEITQSDGFSMS